MKLTVFGASGRTGSLLVQRALECGHMVTGLVRYPAKVPIRHPCLNLNQGNALDDTAVDQAVAGAEAVLNTIGPARNSPDRMMSVVARNIVTAMTKHGVRRLVSLSGAGVSSPRDGTPSAADRFMLGLLRLLAGKVLADSSRAVDIIQASDLDWTILRLPRLSDGPPRGEIRLAYRKPGFVPLARADVAQLMLDQIADPQYVREMPIVTYGSW